MPPDITVGYGPDMLSFYQTSGGFKEVEIVWPHGFHQQIVVPDRTQHIVVRPNADVPPPKEDHHKPPGVIGKGFRLVTYAEITAGKVYRNRMKSAKALLTKAAKKGENEKDDKTDQD